MNHKTRVLLPVVLCALVASLPVRSSEEESFRVGNDVFVAGDEAVFDGEVSGDALLAGGHVLLAGSVGGDAVVTGGRVTVRGTVGEDLYAAGGEVDVTGTVSGSARIAGGEVEIESGGSIADGLSIAGGRVELNGRAGRYVQIAGGEVSINGRVDGDVNVAGGELVIGPDAVIEGSITYRGPRDPSVSSSAQVRGGVKSVREHIDERVLEKVFGFFAVAWLAGWTVVGVLLLVLLPEATRRVTERIRAKPGVSVLLGIAVLCVVPVLAVVSAITLIGIPLALLLLLLYFILLPLGYLASVLAIADWAAPRLRGAKPVTTGARIGAFILALIAVYLVTRIPVLGGLITLALLLAGMGALVQSIRPRSG